MNTDDHSAAILLKLTRAKRFRDEVISIAKAFHESAPYTIDAKLNESGRRVYFLSQANQPPMDLAMALGDMVHNLRTALDHCVYQLWWTRHGSSADAPNNLGFPVFDSEAAYAKKHKPKLQGLSGNAVNAITSLRPYKGGNDSLWALNEFDIIDKHRVLLTVAAGHVDMDFGSFFAVNFRDEFRRRGGVGAPPQIPELFFRSKDTVARLGEELLIDSPGAPSREGLRFRYTLTVHEPSVFPEHVAIDKVVEDFGNAASVAVHTLLPLLRVA